MKRLRRAHRTAAARNIKTVVINHRCGLRTAARRTGFPFFHRLLIQCSVCIYLVRTNGSAAVAVIRGDIQAIVFIVVYDGGLRIIAIRHLKSIYNVSGFIFNCPNRAGASVPVFCKINTVADKRSTVPTKSLCIRCFYGPNRFFDFVRTGGIFIFRTKASVIAVSEISAEHHITVMVHNRCLHIA